MPLSVCAALCLPHGTVWQNEQSCQIVKKGRGAGGWRAQDPVGAVQRTQPRTREAGVPTAVVCDTVQHSMGEGGEPDLLSDFLLRKFMVATCSSQAEHHCLVKSCGGHCSQHPKYDVQKGVCPHLSAQPCRIATSGAPTQKVPGRAKVPPSCSRKKQQLLPAPRFSLVHLLALGLFCRKAEEGTGRRGMPLSGSFGAAAGLRNPRHVFGGGNRKRDSGVSSFLAPLCGVVF